MNNFKELLNNQSLPETLMADEKFVKEAKEIFAKKDQEINDKQLTDFLNKLEINISTIAKTLMTNEKFVKEAKEIFAKKDQEINDKQLTDFFEQTQKNIADKIELNEIELNEISGGAKFKDKKMNQIAVAMYSTLIGAFAVLGGVGGSVLGAGAGSSLTKTKTDGSLTKNEIIGGAIGGTLGGALGGATGMAVIDLLALSAQTLLRLMGAHGTPVSFNKVMLSTIKDLKNND